MKRAQRGFATPPEIISYFDQKSLKPAFSWQDVWAQEHAYAFTVAKAVDFELLALFKRSIADAIKRGEGFESWREKLMPELQRIGWYGPRRVDDPTGKSKSRLVDFSRPRRLETIFWSNVRSARAAGQWERAQRTKAGLPYFLYVRTTSHEPRAEHLAWAGTMLPVDDSFWSTHFPPNGWGCKCSVRQITRFEYEKLKGVDGYSTDAPPIAETTFVNRRSGEVTQIPVGVDPGWHTNPGLARARTLVESVAARMDEAGEAAARVRVREIVTSPAASVLMSIDQKLNLPVAISTRLQEVLGARSAVVWASNETMRAKTAKHAPVEFADFAALQDYLDAGEVIDEDKGAQRSVFITVNRRLLRIIVQMSMRRIMRIASVHPFSRTKLARLKEGKDAAGSTSRAP